MIAVQKENEKMRNDDEVNTKVNGQILMESEQKPKVDDSTWKSNQFNTKESFSYANMRESLKYGNLEQKHIKNSESFSTPPPVAVKKSDELLLIKNIQQMLDVEPTPSDRDSTQMSEKQQKSIDLPEISLEKLENYKARKDDSEENESTSEALKSKTDDEESSFL